jgi:hypothetical protein
VALLEQALDLWYGEALTGLDGGWVVAERDQDLLAPHGAWLTADARDHYCRRHDRLVAELGACPGVESTGHAHHRSTQTC